MTSSSIHSLYLSHNGSIQAKTVCDHHVDLPLAILFSDTLVGGEPRQGALQCGQAVAGGQADIKQLTCLLEKKTSWDKRHLIYLLIYSFIFFLLNWHETIRTEEKCLIELKIMFPSKCWVFSPGCFCDQWWESGPNKQNPPGPVCCCSTEEEHPGKGSSDKCFISWSRQKKV